MPEDLTLIQRIKSASDIDVRTRGFIYELTDKDGRWSFLHRDVDGVFKPNFTKRLFYYINTSEFDLPLSFKEVPYKAEKIDAEVIFRLQLCPTADFDKDPELANWIANERLDVLRASDVKSRLAGRLGAYFSRIVNGATSLALAEQYGKGAFRDDYSAWNDSGLPSWLYIAKTSSADVTRLPTEAEREVQLENERVARAMERTRKVKERIDIAVSEAKLKEVQDAIAHHMEQLRQRRELENAQYAFMLQQIETERERDLRAREIEELEHQIAKDSLRIDLEINYERLKQEQAKTQSVIQDTENKRRHNEARIAKINHGIKISEKRLKLLIREHSIIWILATSVCKWIVAILAILALGVIVWRWMDKGRGELQQAVNRCQKEYSELKSGYRYVRWREDSFKNIEDAIRNLNDKLKQTFFSKAEVARAVDRINILLQEVKALDRSRIDCEKVAFDMIVPAQRELSKMLDDLPADFVWDVGSREVFLGCARQLEDASWNIVHTNQIDDVYLDMIKQWTGNVQKWVGFGYKDAAIVLLSKFGWLNKSNEIEDFLFDEISKENARLGLLTEAKDRYYYEQVMRALHLHDAVKFYKTDLTGFLSSVEKETAFMRTIPSFDFQVQQLEKIKCDVIWKYRANVLLRAPVHVYKELVENARRQMMKNGCADGILQYDAESIKLLRERAEQGNAEAQFDLGVCYMFAKGVSTNIVEAIKWFRSAAEQGHGDAQYNLGQCFAFGIGTQTNNIEAIKWWRMAAERGVADAQFKLGVAYVNARCGVEKNEAEAVKWFGKAAEQGHAAAQFDLGLCYMKGEGGISNVVEGVKWCHRAAELGHADAQLKLGMCYFDGVVVAKDFGEAVKWFRRAAKQGNAQAQSNLGMCYSAGEGVSKKDIGEAVKWWRKAAEQGLKEAQFNLGVCYERGEGVAERDKCKREAEAVKWYRKAAEQGYARAQYNLGVCYYNGKGVTKDLGEAAKWWRKAAEQGDAQAQLNLLVYELNRIGEDK